MQSKVNIGISKVLTLAEIGNVIVSIFLKHLKITISVQLLNYKKFRFFYAVIL